MVMILLKKFFCFLVDLIQGRRYRGMGGFSPPRRGTLVVGEYWPSEYLNIYIGILWFSEAMGDELSRNLEVLEPFCRGMAQQ